MNYKVADMNTRSIITIINQSNIQFFHSWPVSLFYFFFFFLCFLVTLKIIILRWSFWIMTSYSSGFLLLKCFKNRALWINKLQFFFLFLIFSKSERVSVISNVVVFKKFLDFFIGFTVYSEIVYSVQYNLLYTVCSISSFVT